MAKKIITEIEEAVEVDPIEAKRQRKAAKKAAAEAAEAAAVEVEPTEEQLAEEKRKRKEARKAAKAAETTPAVEEEAVAEPTEEDIAEEKRKRKEAKKAAKAAAAAAAEAEEDAEEAEDDDAPPKKKLKKEEAPAEKKDACSSEAPSSDFRLFVGGISWSVDEDTLRKDFTECGEVADLKLLMDRETGNSRGIAFLTMADKKGYDAALKYDGEEYAGRKLNVSKANSDGNKGKGKGKDGKGKGKGKGKGPSEKPAGCTSVVVKGLAYAVTSDDLQACFQNCGSGPTNVNLLKDRDTGESRGMAFVDFADGAAVDEAMKLSETNLKGRSFFMDYSKPRDF